MLLQELSSQQLDYIAGTMRDEFAGPESVIADALRAELWARRTTRKHALINRVFELLQPVYQISLESTKDILESLIYAGDITAGGNGEIAAAPLRVIQLDANRFLLAGGPQTQILQTMFDCQIDVDVIPRRATVTDSSQFLTQLSQNEARILSPERWSGLDRISIANERWITYLNEELVFAGKPASSLATDCDEWTAYVTSAGSTHASWTKLKTDSAARLWRAKHIRGFWIYAWTSGQHPGQGMHIPLSSNDAHRARFSIDRESGSALSLTYERSNSSIVIQLRTLLPIQEYRYLTTIGERRGSMPNSITFPIAALDQVIQLFDRLGITISEQGV